MIRAPRRIVGNVIQIEFQKGISFFIHQPGRDKGRVLTGEKKRTHNLRLEPVWNGEGEDDASGEEEGGPSDA